MSQFNIRYLKNHYGSDADHVVHINNGLPLEEFPYAEPTDRPPLIFAVGRLVEKKGFAELIEACGLMKSRGLNFRCEIAGGGVLQQDLAQQIVRLDLGDCVSLLGPRPQGEIRRKLHESALLAAPCVVAADNDRDGLPTILLEAMAMGTPCVSTDVTGIPEVLIHGRTGLAVAQGDVVALADACAQLLEDGALGVRLARNARNLIEENFDITRNAASIRAFIDSILCGENH